MLSMWLCRKAFPCFSRILRTCFKNNLSWVFFPKYKSNKYYCRIFETLIKILKRKMKFTPYCATFELSPMKSICIAIDELKEQVLRSAAYLDLIRTRLVFFFLNRILFPLFPHHTPTLVIHLYHLTLISMCLYKTMGRWLTFFTFICGDLFIAIVLLEDLLERNMCVPGICANKRPILTKL